MNVLNQNLLFKAISFLTKTTRFYKKTQVFFFFFSCLQQEPPHAMACIYIQGVSSQYVTLENLISW